MRRSKLIKAMLIAVFSVLPVVSNAQQKADAENPYYEAEFVNSQEELDNSKTILTWVHKNADIEWDYFHFPTGKGEDKTQRQFVCFHRDQNGRSHIGKVWRDSCRYAIHDEIAIRGLDNRHPSLRKRYAWSSTVEDYYILVAENEDDYSWIASNKIKDIEEDEYRQFAVNELSVCRAENLTFNGVFRRSLDRGWHVGEAHLGSLDRIRCYYEYGGYGDKAPTAHSYWSRQQVEILYVKLRSLK